MTEDEAKTKWCPFARTALRIDGVSVNRWAYGPPFATDVAKAGVASRAILSPFNSPVHSPVSAFALFPFVPTERP